MLLVFTDTVFANFSYEGKRIITSDVPLEEI